MKGLRRRIMKNNKKTAMFNSDLRTWPLIFRTGGIVVKHIEISSLNIIDAIICYFHNHFGTRCVSARVELLQWILQWQGAALFAKYYESVILYGILAVRLIVRGRLRMIIAALCITPVDPGEFWELPMNDSVVCTKFYVISSLRFKFSRIIVRSRFNRSVRDVFTILQQWLTTVLDIL